MWEGGYGQGMIRVRTRRASFGRRQLIEHVLRTLSGEAAADAGDRETPFLAVRALQEQIGDLLCLPSFGRVDLGGTFTRMDARIAAGKSRKFGKDRTGLLKLRA